ncbi:metallophosphoesterase [uncultured Oscillibacter sp.]|uniref:metallophosphoesterase family protein n=1 Tax=uncultured Oscillibacter sp. TaxID=876091 RepID=UPI0021725692|nr:metallophosphoesterase [uncultured Oscillibacter sp.]MCI9554044.1 metallophosphoesterase [Oscillibacter sp.]
MKLLLLSDKESEYLWDYYRPGRLKDIDLILSCGDLSSKYLTFLVTMAGRPLLYVHGNHDKTYDQHPPEGCDCVEDRLVTVGGLRILGLGGSIRYSGGPHQYTERQMARRVRRLRYRLWRAGGVDIVLTHSPMLGYGDGEDYAHQGFESLLALVDKYHPQYLIHGHVHANYGCHLPRVLQRGETTIINAYERYVLDLENPPAPEG